MARRKKVSRFLDIPAWMGWDNITLWSDNIRYVIKNLLVVQKTEVCESFAQAIERLEFTPEDVHKRTQEFYYMALFYGVLALGALAYCGWLLWHHYYQALILAFVLALVMGSFWFKEHFWYVQMQQQRLGMTILEWFKIGILGKGK